jgi:hypothetical protein
MRDKNIDKRAAAFGWVTPASALRVSPLAWAGLDERPSFGVDFPTGVERLGP